MYTDINGSENSPPRQDHESEHAGFGYAAERLTPLAWLYKSFVM